MADSQPLVILADDLSGAAETAIAFGAGTPVLFGESPAVPSDCMVAVVDLASRSLSEEAAVERTRAAVTAMGGLRPRVKKIDSQLRGNIAAELHELRRSWPGVTVVAATALPELGRSSRGGVVHIDERPLHHTDAWAVENRPAPLTIAAALGADDALVVDRATLQSGGLTPLIDGHRGSTLVVDGEDDTDLKAVVAGVAQARTQVLLVGAAALCRALANTVPTGTQEQLFDARHSLTIIGTASPRARDQRNLLVEQTGAYLIDLTPAQLVTSSAQQRQALTTRVQQELRERDVVLAIASDGSSAPGILMTGYLAEIGAGALAHIAAPLVLTGGETAEAMLARLNVQSLTVMRQAHAGAVVSRTDQGMLVATRPGSFGETDSLLRMRRCLSSPASAD